MQRCRGAEVQRCRGAERRAGFVAEPEPGSSFPPRFESRVLKLDARSVTLRSSSPHRRRLTRAAYSSLGGRTDAGPPLAGIHFIPARSNASFIFSTVANVTLPPFSNRVTVLAVIPAWRASSVVLQPSAALAILTWLRVSIFPLIFVNFHLISSLFHL